MRRVDDSSSESELTSHADNAGKERLEKSSMDHGIVRVLQECGNDQSSLFDAQSTTRLEPPHDVSHVLGHQWREVDVAFEKLPTRDS